jgi:hypothetical protein
MHSVSWKTRVLWTLAAVCLIGVTVGCNKPSGYDKKSPAKQAPSHVSNSK